MAEWTFLTNYALVLNSIAGSPRITARELSNIIGITERTTHKIIADLHEEGYLAKKREGRRNSYQVNLDLPLRDPVLREAAVRELLQALSGKKREHPRKAA